MGGTLPPMKFNVRADLFSQLATMEDAGLPFDNALRLVHLPPRERPRLAGTRKWIRLGIADAGLKRRIRRAKRRKRSRSRFDAKTWGRTRRKQFVPPAVPSVEPLLPHALVPQKSLLCAAVYDQKWW